MDTSQAEGYDQEIEQVQARRIGALPLFYPVLQALRVKQIVNGLVPSEAEVDPGRVVLSLVLNRLLAPQPLYRIGSWLAETVVPEVVRVAPQKMYDNRLGRMLDKLQPYLGQLWRQLLSQAVEVYKLDLRVLHWDITSIYFEGAYAQSELAAYGYSRDHRPDTKQINLEMSVSRDGYIPILYQVLAGNTADITRPLPHLESLLQFLGRDELKPLKVRPILVSDSKMITPAGVLACHQHDLFYLGPLPSSQASQHLLHSVTAAELAAHPLSYRPQRVRGDDETYEPYRGVWRTFSFSDQGHQVTDRALVVWSAGKQRLDEQKRKTYLKRLLNGLVNIQKKLNTRRYKKRAYVEARLAAIQRRNPAQGLVDITLSGEDNALALTFRINRARLVQVQVLDGRYALVTNAPHLDAQETLQLFKGQDGIEKRYRGIKGPLHIHPLFIHTDARIEGIVFMTLVALLVRRLLRRLCQQRGLTLTNHTLVNQFAPLQAIDLGWADGSRQSRVVSMTSFHSQVLTALGWPLPDYYARLPLVPR